MSLLRLIKNNLCFYRGISVGIFLAGAVATAVLTGAMLVGDSVNQSLKMIAESRLGETEFALQTYNKPFSEGLALKLSKGLETKSAGLLKVKGMIATSDGAKRVNKVEVIGVDERFFDIGSADDLFGTKGGVIINSSLAKKLGITDSGEVLVRISKPSSVSRDIPLTPDSDLTVAFRSDVIGVAGKEQFGDFSLLSNHLAPMNVFVPLKELQQRLGLEGQINTVLVANNSLQSVTIEKINLALKQAVTLGDMGLELKSIDDEYIELQSNNIFIEDGIAEIALGSGNGSQGILSYFVNEFRLGDRSTPYSFVSAMQRSDGNLVADDMSDDEIVINRWLADDLGARKGSSIELKYFVVGSGRKLVEEAASFTVKDILPMDAPGLNASLIPEFPGLADKENCSDWDPGIPIDLDIIRDKDEEYWDKYNTTPKAVISLSAGEKIWPNRFGTITAIRYRTKDNSLKGIEDDLLGKIEPAMAGLYFQPVKELAESAYQQSTDFGQLFLGLSFFLIISAAILLSLVFTFGVERRSGQIGFLLATGFTHKQIKRLFFLEAGVLSVFGTMAGSVLAVVYTKAMILGLKTVWRDALAGSVVYFHAETSTIITGAVVSVLISSFAVWLSLRKHLRRPARELLSGNVTGAVSMKELSRKRKKSLYISGASFAIAVVLLFAFGSAKGSAAGGVFFLCGALILTSAISLIRCVLIAAARARRKPLHSMLGLAIRNASRRSSRSLAVVGLISIGCFLVVATGANRQDPAKEAQLRSSGTGGFSIYAETSVPILNDLNSPEQQELTGLDGSVKFVQMRANNGDDASCLNLNRAQRPRIIGINPADMTERGAFTFLKTIDEDKGVGWDVLKMEFEGEVIPAAGDYATLTWALGKGIGDDIDYVDEHGREFKLRIVGMLKDSVFQGSLLIGNTEFEKRFPRQEGYRVLLIDTETDKKEFVTDTLSRNLADFAIELSGADERLARFKTVEHTYLSIFQLLGGLSLILGSVGLGLVVLLNVLDRKAELAMTRAVGFSIKKIKLIIFVEHAVLMLAGLVCGCVSAAIAVFPVIASSASQIPIVSLIMIVSCIAASALVWIYFATWTAMKGPLLDALRNE
jgi:putative ABC transport system permease protein